MERHGLHVGTLVRSMMESKDFATLKNSEEVTLLRLTVAQLGFSDGTTIKQIFACAIALGLELCPAEVGPHYRLQYEDQPVVEGGSVYVNIGMRQIDDLLGDACIFTIGRDSDGLWFCSDRMNLRPEWGGNEEFLFCLRKKA